MSQLYKNKFKVKSMRLKDWDYSQNSFYFITICTKNHQMFFGDVIKSGTEYCPIYKMKLSSIGKITEKYWLEIPKHFSNVKLDEFIIMPNHLHGIIEICNNDVVDNAKHVEMQQPCKHVETQQPCKHVETQQCCVSTARGKSKTFHKLIPKSLPVVIRSFKSVCTKTINQRFPDADFIWQARYYDHIVRNEGSLNEIRKYICDNPQKWDLDKNNIENLYM